jgi:anaerobic ribonucleoside-triphosphate reductase activating protein
MLVHAILPASRANGPGLRTVVFFQGCILGCQSCFNRATHDFRGVEIAPESVAEAVICAHRDRCFEGVTFSGGEPMQQADGLLVVMQRLRQKVPELSFGIFSGYTERELEQGQYMIWRSELKAQKRVTLWKAIRSHLDFAVLGRFNYLQPGNQPLRSSRNQILRLFSGRYSEADFEEQVAEVHIDESGLAEVTGFPTLGLPF